ncbi:uncharacterized protein A1O5_13300 [Cladophialophora psammophila CBS 110553]|uniref:Uncharacterized protein n=1 Tax=Cladophialophora psammophila CBS 110553 TaxID=1182543 RepID=W9VCV8_9EURO|nr:uncharacterized protein A1O5_13300 [Cladophialophora psammophila CBS 110553]EXJ53432.1 hypothetical protein A1O5_13300 [Cladophialophora psammophila CBS 110553]
MGMAFLPEIEAGTFSYYANPSALKHILEVFERILAQKRKMNPSPGGDNIEETLVSALETMMNNIYYDNLYQRAERWRGTLRRPVADPEARPATANSNLDSPSDHIAQVLSLFPEHLRKDLGKGRA